MGPAEWEKSTPAFADLAPVAALMAGFARPWYIAGGWATDLFLGHVTRDHDDVDVAILRVDQAALQSYLAGWDLRVVVAGPDGAILVPWVEGEWLALPVHEIHARRPQGEPAALEMLLHESVGDLWRFRRNLEVVCPLGRIGMRAPNGLPFLAPEIALLYKAKDHRPKDDQDFQGVHAAMSEEPREWLRQALATCHPGHPWLAELGQPTT
jgi:hypothetical protein